MCGAFRHNKHLKMGNNNLMDGMRETCDSKMGKRPLITFAAEKFITQLIMIAYGFVGLTIIKS